jgi:hypothetical protein
MKFLCAMTFCIWSCTPIAFAQNGPVTIEVEPRSALVWGEDAGGSAGVSSSTLDPVTGNSIHKLKHSGIEVGSQAGFERAGSGMSGSLLNVTTTIINTTGLDVFVRRAGASVDGHTAFPIVPETGRMKGRDSGQVHEVGTMYCLKNGFLSQDNFFSGVDSSASFNVAPNAALTVSFVAKDPRSYSLLCSVEGCYPTGTMRFYITVNATDYVFVWSGRSMAYCGK